MSKNVKLRVLCLHSFRTSGGIFKKQVSRSGFEDAISDVVELSFIDAPHVASGPAPDDVGPHFEPPYFEWWDSQTSVKPEGKVSTYSGWQASVAKLREVLIEQGPFDGVMGFSQGGALTACAAALQEAAVLSPPQVPALKFAIMIAGFTPRDPQLARLFSGPLSLPSVHIIGERDMMKRASAQLMTNFDIHTAIWHKQGHVVPRLSEEQLGPLRDFLLQFSARKSRL